MDIADAHAQQTNVEKSQENGETSDTKCNKCSGCGEAIVDRYLLKMDEHFWHEKCLRCCVCQATLGNNTSCFIKEDKVYCRLDYARLHGTKCAACLHGILASDWIRRARDNVYHLACFACHLCQRQLATGEEFVLKDDKVLCTHHFAEMVEHSHEREQEGVSSGGGKKPRRFQCKRPRTIFTEHQLQVLQANFSLDSNPDAQDLERIAQITGLSKRVTQVWFQNNRARQRRVRQTAMSFPGVSYHLDCSTSLAQAPMHRYLTATALMNGQTVPAVQPVKGLSQRCPQCGFTYCHCPR